MKTLKRSYQNPIPVDDDVKVLQRQLNAIRSKYHCSWIYLDPIDGKFGKDTYAAVWAFQKFANIKIDGEVGPETWSELRRLSSATTFLRAAPPGSIQPQSQLKAHTPETATALSGTYDFFSQSVGVLSQLDSQTAVEGEKGLAYILAHWEKMLDHQYDCLMRRINKFPAKKQMRARNVKKQLEYSKKFINEARRYGIKRATAQMGGTLTKENAIKYIKEVGEAISKSPLTKGVKAMTKSFAKIRKLISPVIDCLNKIPGLKYFSVIEKLVKGTIKMINCDYEGAFTLYLDGFRELLEQIAIDLIVGALVAIGGWVALVVAIVVIIGAIVIDYFFFSDNPGESLADKHLNIKTQNLTQNIAPGVYQFYDNLLK